MATRSIDIKVTFDDEEYRQKVSRLKGETAVLKSQLDATKASFKNNEDSVQAMSARIKDLVPLIAATSDRLKVETQEIDKQKNNIATCSTEIKNWNDVISNSKKAISVLSSAQILNANEVSKLSVKYNEAKVRYDDAQKALNDLNSKYTGATRNLPWFKQRLSDAVDEVVRSKDAFDKANDKLQQAKDTYNNTGKAIDSYKKDIINAKNEVTAFTKKQADAEGFLRRHQTEYNKILKALNLYNAELEKNKNDLDACTKAGVENREELEKLIEKWEEEQALIEGAAYASLIKFMQDYAKEIKECVDAYAELETAMIGVAKTNDMTDEQLHNLQETFKDLSVTIPVSAAELAKIAELGGQLGISVEGLEKFATTIANISVSTNLDIEEASTALAQFANIVGLTEDQYERLGSAIVGLGNNFATDEETIMLMAQRFASAGVSADMSAKQIVALATAAGALGFRADAGASGMTKLIEKVKEAVSTGDNLDEFASLAGMSAREFAKAFGEDATGAIAKFLKGLGETGTDMDTYAKRLGFSELRAKRLVTSLAAAEASNGLLSRSIEEANTAWAENVALQREADKFNASLANKIKELQNAMTNLKATVGEQLAPTAEGTVAVAKAGVDAINDLITAFPRLVDAVNIAVAVFGFFALKSLPQTFTSLGLLQAKLVQLATGAFAELTSAAEGAMAAIGSMSAGSLVALGAVTAAIVAAVALMKHEKDSAEEYKEAQSKAYDEEFKNIKHVSEAKKRYAEIEKERQDLLDNLIKKGKQASITEQAEIDVRTEALKKLKNIMSNIHDQAVEDAKRRRSTINDEISAYDELSEAIYNTAKAEDYFTEKKTTEYELTYTKMQENLASQKKWAEDYSKNFNDLINRDIEGIEEWVLSWADGTQTAAEKLAVLAPLTDDEIKDLMAYVDEIDSAFEQIGDDAAALRERLDRQEIFDGMLENGRLSIGKLRELLMSLNGITISPKFHVDSQYLMPHAQGLNYVPYDDYPALLHEGEMVLNRAEARMYRAMEMHGEATSNTNNNITLNVYGAKGQSVDEIANVVMTKIQQATDRRVSVWA